MLPRSNSTIKPNHQCSQVVRLVPRYSEISVKGAKSYFFHKEIAPDKQVLAIIMGIKDHRVKDWYHTNKAIVTTLTFNNFMTQLHTPLLKEGWRNTLQSNILSTTQGKKPFDDWQNSLGTQNSLLLGSTSHIPEQQLCNHLNANMNSDTKTECDENKVHNEPLFTLWVEKVSIINAKHLHEVDKQTCLVNNTIKQSKTILTGPSAHRNKQITLSSSTTTFQPPGGILAKLLNTKQSLLSAHEVCTKCHCFYVNHHAKDCPNSFPAAAGYKPLTDTMASVAKRSKGVRKMMVAAMVEETKEEDENEELVAVVGMSSSVIGNGRDSGSDEYMLLPPQKHLWLNCFVDAPSAHEI